MILILIIGVLLTACSEADHTRNQQAIKEFLLGELVNDTTEVAREAYAIIDTLRPSLRNEHNPFYGTVDDLTFRIHFSGNTKLAARLHRGMLDILEESSYLTETDRHQMLAMYLRLGATFNEGGMPGISLDYYMKGLEMCADSTVANYKAKFYNNIGVLYTNANYYEKATEYFRKALAINLDKKIHPEISLNYSNLAELAANVGQTDEALRLTQATLDHINSKKQPLLLADIRFQQGDLYARNKHYDVAMLRYNSAIEQYQMLNNIPRVIEVYLHISDAYLSHQMPDSAIYYAEKALRTAQNSGQTDFVANSRKRLADINSAEGNYQQALQHLYVAVALEDSLRDTDNRMRLSNWEMLRPDINHRPRTTLAPISLWILIGVSVVLLATVVVMAVKMLRMRGERKAEVPESPIPSEISDKIDLCNRELTTLSIEKLKMHEGISDLCGKLREVVLEINPKETAKRARINALLSSLDALASGESDEEFKNFFERVHPDFYKALHERCPELTPKDMRLCAFLYLGLSTKEIAALTYREIRSVESARNRLRKKMNIDPSQDLLAYLHDMLREKEDTEQ